MKKLKWATHKSLFGQIASSSCLLAVSAGVVFGVSAGTFKVEYLDLNSPEARLRASQEHNYYSQNIKSQWNMYQQGKPGDDNYIKGVAQPTDSTVDADWWSKVHPGTTQLNEEYNGINPAKMGLYDKEGKEIKSGVEISADAQKERQKYSALVIDGSTHTALDRSFNQGLYNGLANFNTNIQHDVVDNSEGQVFKPSQDSTQEFVNIYRAVAAKSRILALAGFNHVTPLNALGERDPDTGLYKFADKNIANAGMMLMDGDVTNNQNIASVLFRSDQPAFLSALATCMYFLNNLDIYHDNYQNLSVAVYGGTAIPTVMIYMGGYQRGIEFFNRFVLRNRMLDVDAWGYINSVEQSSNDDPYTIKSDYFVKKLLPASKYKDEVERLKAYPHEKKSEQEFKQQVYDLLDKLYEEYSVKMIKLGDFATHFSGSFASGDAIGISKQYLNRGASAIIAVAGPQSLDTAQEIMNQHKNCIVIGVDSAMERSDYQKPFTNPNFKDKTVAASGDNTISAQASNIIKFSAVKDMTNVSDKMLRLAATGKNWDVTSKTPWASSAQIPDWTVDEEIPFNSNYYNIKIIDDKTFWVAGFNSYGTATDKMHVMNIPAIWKDADGKVRTLAGIYGFDINNLAHTDKLKKIDTLKISCSESFDGKISLGTSQINAFNYHNWDSKSQAKPGIKYIDLGDLHTDNFEVGAYCFYDMCKPVHGITPVAYKNGIIKFHKRDTDAKKQALYSAIFAGVDPSGTAADDPWAIIEPDPYGSICTFGFKTCGNIENGLISISWDGWPFLFDALRHCSFVDKASPDAPVPFMQIWDNCANAYVTAKESEVTQDFYKFVTDEKSSDWTRWSTFNTESCINKNYSHVMAILGLVLNRSYAIIPKDMTVLFNDKDEAYLPDQSQALTILDWLRLNMYFTL